MSSWHWYCCSPIFLKFLIHWSFITYIATYAKWLFRRSPKFINFYPWYKISGVYHRLPTTQAPIPHGHTDEQNRHCSLTISWELAPSFGDFLRSCHQICNLIFVIVLLLCDYLVYITSTNDALRLFRLNIWMFNLAIGTWAAEAFGISWKFLRLLSYNLRNNQYLILYLLFVTFWC